MNLLFNFLIFFGIISFVLSRPSSDQLKAFENWAREQNDLISEKISIKSDGEFDGSLRPGVIALQDITIDEVIADFPREFIITTKFIEFHDIGELVPKVQLRFSNGLQHDPAPMESLALFVLYEKYMKGDESSYKPWLDVLPQPDEMNNILFWKAHEIKWLEGSSLLERANDRRKENKEHWDFIRDNLIIPYDRLWKNEVTEDMYKWAISIVRSRAVQIAVRSGDVDVYEPGLVPFFDMFHHKPLIQEASWEFDLAEKMVSVRADVNYKAGDEIFVSFGEKCNSELLDFHGYVLEGNTNDCVHMDLQLSKSDPLYREKNNIYQLRAPDNSKLKMTKGGITLELLRGARIVTLDSDMITQQMLLRGCPDESIGLISDYRIAHYLLDSIRDVYTSYPTEDDIEGVDTLELPLRRRLAKQLKDGEKDILRTIGTYYFSEAERLGDEITARKDEL